VNACVNQINNSMFAMSNAEVQLQHKQENFGNLISVPFTLSTSVKNLKISSK
jgi:hypothetical protein